MMKVSVVSLLVFLLPSQGAGLSLLSLLTGRQSPDLVPSGIQAEERSAEAPEVLEYSHLHETREAKNVDIETDEGRGFLDTLNLSLAGNLDISNAVGQVSIDGVLSPL